mmetsp:Transcript_659/g.549  ORF Transcript_659/g.549 Transcript_659/m.549 type:complete len:133 (+) Transcript_659:537-935(+)
MAGYYDSDFMGLYERLNLLLKDHNYYPGLAEESIITYPTTSVVEIVLLMIINNFDIFLRREFKWIGLSTSSATHENSKAVATVAIMINEFMRKDNMEYQTIVVKSNNKNNTKDKIKQKEDLVWSEKLGFYSG